MNTYIRKEYKIKRTLLLFLLVTTTSSGCSFLEARGKDFADCFHFSADAGLGLGTHIQIGPAGMDIGAWWGVSAGLPKKARRLATWGGFYVGIPFVNVLPLLFKDGDDEDLIKYVLSTGTGAFSIDQHSSYIRGQQWINYLVWADINTDFGKTSLPNEGWAQYFWVSLSIHCFVGGRVGFNFAEFADFILGWFGLDICGDDDLGPTNHTKSEEPAIAKESPHKE